MVFLFFDLNSIGFGEGIYLQKERTGAKPQ